jgi:hypothetical protein
MCMEAKPVKVMCKYCGSVFDVIQILIPDIFI